MWHLSTCLGWSGCVWFLKGKRLEVWQIVRSRRDGGIRLLVIFFPPNFPPSGRFVISQSWLIKHRPNRFIWVGLFWRESGLANHRPSCSICCSNKSFSVFTKSRTWSGQRPLRRLAVSSRVHLSAPASSSLRRQCSEVSLRLGAERRLVFVTHPRDPTFLICVRSPTHRIWIVVWRINFTVSKNKNWEEKKMV